MPRQEKKEEALAFLVERLAREGTVREGSGCPGEDQLAALAAGGLLPEERESVERHLERCRPCRDAVAALVRWHRDAGSEGDDEAIQPESTAGAERVRHGPRLLLLAAAVILMAALIWVGKDFFAPGEGLEFGTSSERLADLAEDLAKADPGLFESFVPLSREERLAPSPVLLRSGGIVLLHPAGASLALRPRFDWEPVAGAAEYRVTLLTSDGVAVWEEETGAASLDYPAGRPELTAGTGYLWEVRCEEPLGGEFRQRRAFRTASESERASFKAAIEAVEARDPGAIGLLLQAQLAVRLGFYRQAEYAARAYVLAGEEDALGRETLFHVLQLIGSPEARMLGIEETGRK
jgi:hypothetical protein